MNDELFYYKETKGELIITAYFERYKTNGHSKLAIPAETILAGQVGSFDLEQPIEEERLKFEISRAWDFKDYPPWFLHTGALALAAENDGFRELGADLLDELIDYCVRNNHPEQTAYFRDLKRRKFGFTRDDLDL